MGDKESNSLTSGGIRPVPLRPPPPWVLYFNFWLSLSPFLDSCLRYHVRPFPPNLTIFTHCAIIKGRHLFQTRQILHGVWRSLQGWLWEEGIRLHLVSQERLQLPGTVDRLGKMFPHSKHYLIWRAVHWWMRNPWPKVGFFLNKYRSHRFVFFDEKIIT